MDPWTRAMETHKLTGRRPVMAPTLGAEETVIRVFLPCACFYCTKDATIELLGLAGSRLEMK